MLIPIKCFTCGKVLADLYRYYQQEVRELKINNDKTVENVIYLTEKHTDKTPEGIVMDKLELHKYCCRRHILTHVDIT